MANQQAETLKAALLARGSRRASFDVNDLSADTGFPLEVVSSLLFECAVVLAPFNYKIRNRAAEAMPPLFNVYSGLSIDDEPITADEVSSGLRHSQRKEFEERRAKEATPLKPGLTIAEWLAGVKSASKTLSQRLPASGLKLYSSNEGDTRDVAAHETLTPSELMELVHEAANLDGLDGIAMSIPSEQEGESFETALSDLCDALGITLDDLLAGLPAPRDSKGSIVESLLARANELAAADGKAKRVYVIDGVEQVLERLQDEAFVLLLSPREFDKLVALRVNELPVLLAHTPRKS